MLTGIIHQNDKFDIELINFDKNVKKYTYSSKIYGIIEEDKIIAVLPAQNGTVVPLPINEKYELFIYSKSGLYRCKAMLTERYRRDGLYLMVLEIYTGLQKYQRREYYRLTRNLEVAYSLHREDDQEDDKENDKEEQQIQLRGRGITLDISGGGIRFVSIDKFEKGTCLNMMFMIPGNEEEYECDFLAKIVHAKAVPNKENTFEYRVQFETISIPDRERLIKFIFEEERRSRKKEKS